MECSKEGDIGCLLNSMFLRLKTVHAITNKRQDPHEGKENPGVSKICINQTFIVGFSYSDLGIYNLSLLK